MPARTPSGLERDFGDEELIVSKTDSKGIIRYANDVFVRLSGYSRQELLGRPHSLIRHPDMPGGVFRYMWQSIAAGREVFAFVNNLAKDGAHYWVLAHVTPTFGPDGAIIGYHSNRRRPDRAAVRQIEPLYARMRAAEQGHARRTDAAEASLAVLERDLRTEGLSYDQFVWQLVTASLVPA